MKLRSERDTLVEVLNVAGRAAGGRGTSSAVLSGILLACEGNRLVATGTDLDLSIQVTEEVIGIESGACVVPARLSAEIVRSLEPGAVTLSGTEEKVEITAARSHFELRAFPAVEFPSLSVPSDTALEIPAEQIARGLRQVVRAASKDDARPLLTGVLVAAEGDGLRLVATDSYRLAMRDLSGVASASKWESTLVPARALEELLRLPAMSGADPGAEAGVQVTFGRTDVAFTLGGVRIATRLLEGTYPDYRQLIPESYSNTLAVAKESLLAALRRVRLLVRDNITPVRISMRPGGADLTVVSQEIGEATETVDGDFTGEPLVIAFNPTYLIEGAEAVSGDEVLIETAEPSRPATVRGAEGSDYRYLLMPVRVS